jgi:hypothetical protein
VSYQDARGQTVDEVTWRSGVEMKNRHMASNKTKNGRKPWRRNMKMEDIPQLTQIADYKGDAIDTGRVHRRRQDGHPQCLAAFNSELSPRGKQNARVHSSTPLRTSQIDG